MWRTSLSVILAFLASAQAYADDIPFVPDQIVDRVATEASLLVIVLLILLVGSVGVNIWLVRHNTKQTAHQSDKHDETLTIAVKAIAENTGAVEALRSAVDHTNQILILSGRKGGTA